jgi:hypothetical protein
MLINNLSTSEATSNFILSTSNALANVIRNLNADMIINGTSHQFIIDNKYDANLFIDGTLTASNLNIIGTSTIINTTSYTTENLLISTDGIDGPALTIDMNGQQDIMMITCNSHISFIIDKNNNVGIGVSNPSKKLEVAGITKSEYFEGNGMFLYNVNLSDKTTSELAEGSNLYYKNELVGELIDSSNISLSNDIIAFINNLNFTAETSNELIQYINTKQNTIIGAASTIVQHDLFANKVVVSTITGKITTSPVTTTELNYLSGASNNIQNQIDDILLRTTDELKEGTSNKYIVNDAYNSDLHIHGSLYASNLYIIGDTTTIQTTTYQSENLNIINTDSDGPSLTIAQNTNLYDIVQVYNNDIPIFVVSKDNNIGIGVSQPDEKLQVDGMVKADYYIGSGIYLHNVNLSDKSTSELAEGSNLYYTSERVSKLIDSSNIDLSNLITSGCAIYAEQIMQTTCNNILTYIPTAINAASNELYQRMYYLHMDALVYSSYHTGIASNALANFVINTSNNIIEYVNDLAYILDTSNEIIDYVSQTSNVIIQQINNLNADNITNGTMHKFIVNDSTGDLFVDGTLIASNLHVIGNTTIINSTTYQAENIHISTDKTDGPAVAIDITGDNTSDIMYVSSNDNPLFRIDYLGNIYADGTHLYNVNLNDKTTSELAEGSNLYFTYDRVSSVIDASNVIINQYISTKQNLIIGAATTILNHDLLQNKVLVSSITGKVGVSTINTTELSYLGGASNNIQKQIDELKRLPVVYNADMIPNGTSNRYITYNTYDTDLTILGTLIASNLHIIGETTSVNTISYQTENVQIITAAKDGPALSIIQSGDGSNNLVTATFNDSNIIVIKSSGNVGIGVSEPTSKMHVDGTISGTHFIGDGSSLFNVNLDDRSTSMLAEGSNLYYTPERVSILISSSNTNLSNILKNDIVNTIQNTSNSLSIQISDTSNYISSISDALSLSIRDSSNSLSIQISDTSNYISTISDALSSSIKDTSNYISTISDALSLSIRDSSNSLSIQISDTSNYISTISDALSSSIQDTSNTLSIQISDTSNYISTISDALSSSIQDTSNTLSIQISDTSNYISTISDALSSSIRDTSNYISTISDALSSSIQDSSNSLSIQISDTSNYISTISDALSSSIQDTSNIINERITNLNADMIADGTSHRFIINDIYNTDLTVAGTLTTSNLHVIGTTTVINTTKYETENIEITSTALDGPSLLIAQTGNGSNNLVTATFNDSNVFVIKSSGNIGIGVSEPGSKLQVDGTITGTYFTGDGSSLFNVNMNDRTTSLLAEGSNLYYTPERVTTMIDSCNIRISNMISGLSNYTRQQLANLNTDMVSQGTSNFYYKQQYFDASLATKTLDNIRQGSSNQCIINGTYNNNLSINGGISVDYLIIDGVRFYTSSNTIKAQDLTMNTDMITEGTSNLYFKQAYFDMMFSNRSLNEIQQGTSNKYIINNVYDDDLTVQGTLTVDNIIVHNNISVINNSIYNSECLNIANYTDNPSINILQIGQGDILQVYNDYNPVFVMNNQGYIGNITEPNYNIDISGIINATYLRGSGVLISNINLSDKNTSELAEGSNLYFTEQRVYDILYGENYMSSNSFIPFISHIYSNVVNDLDSALETIACINLDRIIQGSNNKYIVNNIYNDSLIVNGTLTVRNINIIDMDTDFYTDIYNSNLYNPSCSSSNLYQRQLNVSNIVLGILDNYPIQQNTTMIESTSELPEGSNLYFTEQRVFELVAPIQSNIINITSNIDDIKDALCCINLDNVVQGSNNKYIVNNIYNDSLLINGILTVRNIHIIDVDEKFYSDQYNANLYQPVHGSGSDYTSSLNVSNIVSGMMGEYDDLFENLSYALTSETTVLSNKISNIGQKIINTSNLYVNDINVLKTSIDILTSNLNTALSRIAVLESMI